MCASEVNTNFPTGESQSELCCEGERRDEADTTSIVV